MENLIAKLLRDFEDGFLNRRQLIQNLAIAATAAGASSAYAQQSAAAPPAASAPPKTSPFRTVDLDHISYQVKDYRVTRDFYADLMGMDVTSDNGSNQCELHFGTGMIIARNRRQPATPPVATPEAAAPAQGGRGNRPPVTSLVDHISYRIFNWDTDRVREELLRRKLLTENSRPDTGNGIPNYSSFHVSDPDGFNLQISGWAGPTDSVTKKK